MPRKPKEDFTPIHDGKIEVAIAIAATTDLVKVDPTADPFKTTPTNLFSLKFNDDKVRIDDDQMVVFKGNLKILLSEISADIEQIPENSNQVIRKVAKFVQEALMGAG